MGIIGEKLKEKGWSKTKIEWLSIGITLLFFAVLIWFVFYTTRMTHPTSQNSWYISTCLLCWRIAHG
jgi:hypothetical protein